MGQSPSPRRTAASALVLEAVDRIGPPISMSRQPRTAATLPGQPDPLEPGDAEGSSLVGWGEFGLCLGLDRDYGEDDGDKAG
jgi:hypothetical protein